MKTSYDVIIIGGGIAGISCALELHDSKVDYLVIDERTRIGGQLPDVENTIRNYAGRFYQSGGELRDEIENMCRELKLNLLVNKKVENVDLAQKQLTAGGTPFSARTLFLATGYRIRELELPNYEDVERSIVYNCEKNEQDLAGRRVVVVGGGDNALMDTLWLAERCPHVLVVHRSDKFKARPDVVRDALANSRVEVLYSSDVTAANGKNGFLESINVLNKQTQSNSTHEVERLVVKIGYAPNTELFASQLVLENSGHINVDATGATTIPGVFAGGDIVAPPYPRIARAAGHGVTAAGAIRNYLK